MPQKDTLDNLRTPICFRILTSSFTSVSIFSLSCYSIVSISVFAEDSHTFVGKSEGELKGWDSKDPLVNLKSPFRVKSIKYINTCRMKGSKESGSIRINCFLYDP
jgi:hypothetical protein